MAMLATLVLAGSVLFFTALSSTLELPKEGALAALNTWPGSAYGASDSVYGAATGNLNNSGAHGFSELFYAYASATGNNGSAFAGITANTPWYNVTLGLAMLIGRFLMIVPLLALAGALAKKSAVPPPATAAPAKIQKNGLERTPPPPMSPPPPPPPPRGPASANALFGTAGLPASSAAFSRSSSACA